jgi:hypothetical protein
MALYAPTLRPLPSDLVFQRCPARLAAQAALGDLAVRCCRWPQVTLVGAVEQLEFGDIGGFGESGVAFEGGGFGGFGGFGVGLGFRG